MVQRMAPSHYCTHNIQPGCNIEYVGPQFLNQARAGLWPARAWFLEITLMRTSVCVCGMCLCVCVSAPRLLETSGVICGVM